MGIRTNQYEHGDIFIYAYGHTLINMVTHVYNNEDPYL